MPRVTKRRPQTVTRLLDAATDVLAERGFYGASIEEICDRAGLTRGAFYSNFTSKEQLFFQLYERHAHEVVAYWSAVVGEIRGSEDPLEALYKEVDRRNAQDQRWFVVSTEFSIYAFRNPETAEVLAGYDTRLREQIELLLREVLRSIDRRPTVDMNLVARLAIALHEGGMLQSLAEPSGLPFGTLERTFMPHLLHGASRATGRRPTRTSAQPDTEEAAR